MKNIWWLDREVQRRISSIYRRGCVSSGKIYKTEEVDREERKIKELNKEAMFPKDNILGNTKLMRDRIITLIPLLSFAIAKETTKSRSRLKFVVL